MIPLTQRDGLLFVTANLSVQTQSVVLQSALIDAGSAGTVIYRDLSDAAGIAFLPTDRIVEIVGVGGNEYVIEKRIEQLSFAGQELSDVILDVGGMHYGIAVDAVIGLDILTALRAVIDLSAMELRFAGSNTSRTAGSP